MAPPEELMNPQQLADFLGVPLATVYAWRYRGDGPRASKIGRHVRFRRSDVDQWLDDCAGPATASTSLPETEEGQ